MPSGPVETVIAFSGDVTALNPSSTVGKNKL